MRQNLKLIEDKKQQSLAPAVSEKVKNKILWYFKDVNINYSFSSLENLAKNRGGVFENGDIIVADNARRTRRKIFKKTPNAYLILYVSLNGSNLFTSLKDKSGKVDNEIAAILHYLTYEYIQD